MRRSAETSPGRNSRVFPFFSSVICLVFSVSMELLFLNRRRIQVRSRDEDLKSDQLCYLFPLLVITARMQNELTICTSCSPSYHECSWQTAKPQHKHKKSRRKNKYRVVSAVIIKTKEVNKHIFIQHIIWKINSILCNNHTSRAIRESSIARCFATKSARLKSAWLLRKSSCF